MKLWSGRISGTLDELAAQLNNSLPFDRRLAQVDVRGSIAWARALARAGVLAENEADEIVQGLLGVMNEFETGKFDFKDNDEDIHTAVERRLTEKIGLLGGKLHTGRSRNDQVATDFCLWMRDTVLTLEKELAALQHVLVERAEKDWGVILPGYTHFQQAQPLLLSHWWLSHFWSLQRDRERLQAVYRAAQTMPLGCGALAGTSFPIDRFALAADLGFSSPSPNSLDAVSNRDFAAEFLFWAAMFGIHLSRMAEALILYSTSEFGFVVLSDAYSTGSSLMPQKKNPDPLELARAKSGVLTGKLVGLLGVLKGLPSAYDKDLQEDKQPVFEASDLIFVLLPVMGGLIASLSVRAERTLEAINPQVMATDLADFLVKRGIPFRQAHEAVGKAVWRAEEMNLSITKLPLEIWQEIHPAFSIDLFQAFDPQYSIAQRSAFGGTAPTAVSEQLELAKKLL